METAIGYTKDEALGEKIGVDEVFEEALEPETPVSNSEKSQKIVGGNMEALENGGQDSNLASGIEKPEGLIGVPDAAQHLKHNGGQAEIPISDAETQNDVEVVLRDETSDTNAAEKEKEFKETVTLAPNDGKKSDYPSYFDMVIKGLKHEDSVSENVSSLGTSNSEDSKNLDAADTGQESIDEVFETPRFNVVNGSESDQQKPDTKGYVDGILEIQDANEVNKDDVGSVDQENGVLHHETKTGTSNNEVAKSGNDDVHSEQLEMPSSAVKDATDVKQSEGDSVPVSESDENACQIGDQNGIAGVQSESESNGDVIHTSERNVTSNEPVSVLGHGDQQENSDMATQNLESKDLVGEEEMQHEVPNTEDVDKMKDMEPESVEFQRVDSQVAEKDATTGLTADVISSAGDANQIYEAETNLPPLVESSTPDLEIAKVETPNLAPSKLLAEMSSPKEIVEKSDTVSETVTDVPGKEGGKDDTKEEAVSKNEEHECGIISSPGESTVSKTSPHHPELTADVQRPVPLDTPINGEKEVKPKAVISSSAETVTTSRPAGLGHTAPLLQPTQNAAGNKESGSRATSNVQPAKITSASPARPAGLGRDAPLLEPATRVAQHPRVNGGTSPPHNQLVEDQNGDAEEYDETREKLQMIRVKFLRLAHRLGQTPHNVVVAQVLYRLGLAEQLRGRSGGRVGAFSFDRASAMAEQLEAAGQEPLDFTCTIMVLGKSGVGKSATINSIFDENMFGTDAFHLGTKKVQDIVGTVQGIRVRVIDTPGLLSSWSDQRQNEKILHSVKRFIKKTPPDIVLYLDRLDMQGRDFGETPLLRTITDIFGPSIWFNAIVVLTHAASAPPEGPNGTATSYDMFVTQRSHIVQQAIRQAAGDMRLMNPVSLVENHSACRTNRAGQRVLPNGQVWKPHLLLLSFASKILAEANTLLKLQDSPPGRTFAPRTRSPPLPFLLSSLLQSRPEVKLPSEQFGDDDDALDDDLDDSSDSEDEVDYDELPPFKPMTKEQLNKLPPPQRKSYYDEFEYREKLFIKKQLKEEKKRRKMMKKMQEALKDMPPEYNGSAEEETANAASVPVPMPDLSLPASFDSDYPSHRYRSLDSNPWIVRAVLEQNGWDHDIGYDGINAERLFVVKDKVPVSFSGHISKDKKDANIQMEVASSIKHGKGKATSLGFEMQSVGKDMIYTMRSETRFSNHKMNKASAGISATLLGDVLTGGIKLEDKLLVGKRGQVVVSGGGIYGRGDVAYGGSLEATLKDKDQPLGRFLSTLGVSVMDWHGDLAVGWNSQTQIPIGRSSNLIARFNISNRGSGQVSVKVNSSEHLQIVLIGMIPLVKKLLGNDKNG